MKGSEELGGVRGTLGMKPCDYSGDQEKLGCKPKGDRTTAIRKFRQPGPYLAHTTWGRDTYSICSNLKHIVS